MEAITHECIIEERVDIDPDIIRLYNGTVLTLKQIAKEVGVSESRVKARVLVLLKHGEIVGRGKGFRP